MKNKLLSKMFFFPCLLIFMSACPTLAQDNYFEWRLGLSQVDAEAISGQDPYAFETVNKKTASDDVFAFSVAYGHDYINDGIPLRLEIEGSLRGSVDYTSSPIFTTDPLAGDISSDINSHTLFLNLYLDIIPNSPITPYVGGGGGLAWNIWETDDWWWDSESETTTSFAWHAGGGIAFTLNRRLLVDIRYRYIDFGEAEFPGLLKIDDITSNEAQVGLRFKF